MADKSEYVSATLPSIYYIDASTEKISYPAYVPIKRTMAVACMILYPTFCFVCASISHKMHEPCKYAIKPFAYSVYFAVEGGLTCTTPILLFVRWCGAEFDYLFTFFGMMSVVWFIMGLVMVGMNRFCISNASGVAVLIILIFKVIEYVTQFVIVDSDPIKSQEIPKFMQIRSDETKRERTTTVINERAETNERISLQNIDLEDLSEPEKTNDFYLSNKTFY